jgi:hypothetical protein
MILTCRHTKRKLTRDKTVSQVDRRLSATIIDSEIRALMITGD